MPEFPESERIESNEVKGCQSKVWLTYKFENGKLYFQADSNTAITKGIVALLVFLLSDLSPKEISEASLDILDKIELRKHLTSQRNNGLTAMVQKMKTLATSANN
jgi:cysteine desulfuration protein SufE